MERIKRGDKTAAFVIKKQATCVNTKAANEFRQLLGASARVREGMGVDNAFITMTLEDRQASEFRLATMRLYKELTRYPAGRQIVLEINQQTRQAEEQIEGMVKLRMTRKN